MFSSCHYNNDQELAKQIVEEIGGAMMARYREFVKTVTPIEEAIRKGMDATGPIVLADIADNPGGGGPGDGTHILRKLLEMGAKNVGFAVITDPEVVSKLFKQEYVQLLKLD
ncbi:MAG: MlrC C-terminal domain-containing protein [bacterium]